MACEYREVNEVKRGLHNEGNVTDVKERETNEERQTRLVNLCCHLHISVIMGTSYKLIVNDEFMSDIYLYNFLCFL